MEFPFGANNYTILHKVGKDEYSNIYVARCNTNARTVAVKRIDLEEFQIDLDKLHKEMIAWATCNYPNMVHYYCSFLAGAELWIITEFVDGGSIHDIIQYTYSNGFQDETLIASILQGVIQFLIAFHKDELIHRDIKPQNILLGSNGEVRVTDLSHTGSLIESGQRKRARKTIMGNPVYTAPEVLKDDNIGYTMSADIWSLGICAYEMATGKTPYSDLSPLDQVQKVLTSSPPTLSSDQGFSPQFIDFVKKCLTFNPDKRPTAQQLFQHKFIQSSKGQNYIASLLMQQLPPLWERYDILHEGESEHVPKTQNLPKDIFDFNLEEKTPVKEIKTRRLSFNGIATPNKSFMMTVTPPPNQEKEHNPQLIEMSIEVNHIKDKLDEIEKQHFEIQSQIDQTAHLVQKLLKKKNSV